MKESRRLVLGLLLAILLIVVVALPVSAADPQVTITVKAQIVSITNSRSTWDVGTIEIHALRWFNDTATVENQTYSKIINTGNVRVDVEIQGTNFTGTYNWTLASTNATEQYSLYANTQAVPGTYGTEVKLSDYSKLTTNLSVSATYNWSMKFSAPTGFNASDDGSTKTAYVTLVASKNTTG